MDTGQKKKGAGQSAGEKRKLSGLGMARAGKDSQWKDHVILMGIILGAAFWLNRGIEIKGLYMDDLYLWSCYWEQSFLQYVFPIGSTRFRFLHYLAAWLEMMFVGTHVNWFVPINIIINTMVAWAMYLMGRKLSGSKGAGFLCGLMYLASRLSYYQIGQVLGLMETMALWMGLGILWYLFRYLNEEKQEGRFYAACALYFGVCFVHERYMALFPLLLLVLLMKKCRRLPMWGAAVGSFLLMQLIRFFAIGTVMPAGTGRTQVAETFSIGEALNHAFCEIGYVFGINAGPDYLNGCPWGSNPLAVKILVLAADLLIAVLTIGFIWNVIRQKDKGRRGKLLANAALFVIFIGLTIAAACVTIRVEMRWIYISFAAALLFMAYMYGALTGEVKPEFYLKRFFPWGILLVGYVVFMLPVELFMRTYAFPNIYFFPEQARYNSLAEVTHEKYGNMEGKTVYIIGNSYEVSDFTARTFFKVFQKEDPTQELTNVQFIDSVWDFGLVDENMIILQEDPDHDQYIDITEAVRTMKLSTQYGYYYKDHWMDERGCITVMAGANGIINLEIMFPGVMEGGEEITITVGDRETKVIPLTSSVVNTQIQAAPWERVQLTFAFNFYSQNATEQRSDYRLAALVFPSVE